MIEIENRHIDYYCGQHDMALIATSGGRHAGTLRYAVFEGRPSVTMIEVVEGMRRQGIGTSLIVALQNEYPDIPIRFGCLTEDGSALLSSIEWEIQPNTVHSEALRKLSIVEGRLSDYSTRAQALAGASQLERDAFVLEVADWNDLHNEADELRDIVGSTDATLRFAVGPRPVQRTQPSDKSFAPA